MLFFLLFAPRRNSKTPGSFNKVFDGRGRRVRGLWERNGNYYAQVQAQDWVGRVHLKQADTLAQAVAGLQGLKTEIRAGEIHSKTPGPVTAASIGSTGPSMAQRIYISSRAGPQLGGCPSRAE